MPDTSASPDPSPGTVSTTRSRPVAAFVKRVLRLVIISYVVILIVLGFFQRKLLYRPSVADALPIASFPQATGGYSSADDVDMVCRNGETIRGWLLREPGDTPRPLVLYFHGNARNRSDRGPWYELLRDAGLDVLAIDYQGYGDSGGKTTEATIEQSCDATWTYATTELGYAPDQLVVAGTSLGGAAAVYTAHKQSQAGAAPSCLFVTATFSSMADVAGSLYWWVPVRALLVDTFPSAQRASGITCPVLVMHGDVDKLVDQKFGERLFEAFPETAANGMQRRWQNLAGISHHGIVENGYDTILLAIRGLLHDVALAADNSNAAALTDRDRSAASDQTDSSATSTQP